jgi:hypothetical protein
MDCEQFDQIVMDLLYGEAGEEHSAEAKRHVERCERCASALSDLRGARKLAVFPMVEAPRGFEPRLLEAARQFQKEIPWPRRIGRWVSWAGAYAMRPQLAMAALLLLMIGSSLLLIRGRPGSEQIGVVRVTEQGVPEREGMDHPPVPDPAQLPPAVGELPPREPGSDVRGRAGLADNGTAAREAKAPDELSDSLARDAGEEERAIDGRIPSPTGDRAAMQQSNLMPGAPPSESPSDPYSEAMAMYRAKDFVSAYRAFDSIAMSGGANAASAALYAAKSVRASSGCPHALPRFESIAARFSGAGAAIEARWEAASCARIMGDFTRARLIYRDLARVESQRERAERELARISGHGQDMRTPAASAAPRSKAADADQDKKTPPNAVSY